MFASDPQPGLDGKTPAWFERITRRYPLALDALIVVLAVIATAILLMQRSSSFVLYQGF